VKLVEECRKHSKVALQVLEDTLINEVIMPQLAKLSKKLGFSDLKQMLDYYEKNPDELSVEKLYEALHKHRIVATFAGLMLGWIRKKGGLSYQEALVFARECGFRKMLSLLQGYPYTTKKLLEALNILALGEAIEPVGGSQQSG
jgi:uncharacterized protein YabN with tetrapyrrole methylase and pyrophosphatase domain